MPTTTERLFDIERRCQRCAARQHCFVGGLPPDIQSHLDPLIREISFRKGETLQTEGEVPTVVRSIKLGTVVLTRNGPDGCPHPVALAGRGHLLGLWGLLEGGALLGAEALSSVRICELPASALRQVLGQECAFQSQLHVHMSREHSLLADWAALMRLQGLPTQLMAALMLQAREQGSTSIQLPSQVAMARLLGASRESVARALRQIEERGYLRRVDRWHGELTGTHRLIFRNSA